MSFGQFIKEIGRGERGANDLAEDQARQLFGAMLDGGVPDLELGAILIALRMKGESVAELVGFRRAAAARLNRLAAPSAEVRPAVIPSYNGAKRQPNLTPLVALLLARLGVPALVHGTLEGQDRVASAYVLRELGILPCTSAAQAQAQLAENRVAFVPTGVLAPGLANLLALRGRLGVRSCAHSVVKLIDPFDGAGVCVVGVTHPHYLETGRGVFLATGARGLLFRGTDGESFANPRKRPRIEHFADGRAEVLFEAEHTAAAEVADMPQDIAARPTAAYIRNVLDGRAPVPLPIANQVACCLYASGFAADFNQAKAIAAMRAHARASV
ncbi:MAG: DNA-binding protein YbiB [Burkholderiales bacterium]|nr:DNA-binding protein YbiB [Burkholderiales bacterium]